MTSERQDRQAVCPGCGGSGQINYFKGVSRFLLSSEECPECAGLGFVFADGGSANHTAGDKQSGRGKIICYCFGYTVKNIRDDYLKNGQSLIVKRIMAEKRAGACLCAEKNPGGR